MPAPSELPAYRRERESQPPCVAILGAGPVGLEAALYARRLGLKTLLFEREAAVAADVRAWGHVSMFTRWADVRTPLGELALREAARAARRPPALPRPALYPTGEKFVEKYLERLARLLGDSLHLETRVAAVGRSYLFPHEHDDDPQARQARRFRLLTRSPREERVFTADYVLDATGVTHSPRWMGVGGMPALGEMGSRGHIFYNIPDIAGRDRIHFLGKRVLLVGDGPSAATSATLLAELLDKDPPMTLLWASKTRAALPVPLVLDDPLPRRDLVLKKANLLAAQGQHPRLEYLPTTQVEAVEYSLASGRFQVTLQVDTLTRRVMVDSVIANVGSRSEGDTFERALHPAEPGLFTLGSKAAACDNKDFLLPTARAQIRDAFRIICADPELDLYAQAVDALSAQNRLHHDPKPDA